MDIVSLTKKALICCIGCTLFVSLIPIVLATLLLPFFGGVPLAIVSIAYSHFLAWPFGVAEEFKGQVNYRSTLERSSIFECHHIAVELRRPAQGQPFSHSIGDKDWQPQVGGPPEAQPKGSEAWLKTPLQKKWIAKHTWEMRKCGFSTAITEVAQNALSQPGSWVAYSTRGMNKVFIYSSPFHFALVYSNET